MLDVFAKPSGQSSRRVALSNGKGELPPTSPGLSAKLSTSAAPGPPTPGSERPRALRLCARPASVSIAVPDTQSTAEVAQAGLYLGLVFYGSRAA